MKLRRYSISYNEMERVGNAPSVQRFEELLNSSTKITLSTTNVEIERVKNILTPYELMGVELTPGKKKLLEWCKNPVENVSNCDRFFLGEWLNAFELGSKIKVVSNNIEYTFEMYTNTAIEDDELDEIYERTFQYKVLENGKTVVYDTTGFLGNFPETFLIFKTLEDFKNVIQNKKAEMANWSFQKALKELANATVSSEQVNLEQARWDESSELNCWELLDLLPGVPRKIVEIIFQNSKPKKDLNNVKKYLRLLGSDLTWKINVNNEEVNVTYTYYNNTITADKYICPRCGNLYTEKWTLPNGDEVCASCVTNNMRHYDSSRMLGYHSRTISNIQNSCGTKPSEKSRYGFELEMILNVNKGSTNYYNDWLPSWYKEIAPIIYSNGNLAKLERDGSLGSNGEELISQPLNKEFILGDKMKELLNSCEKLYHPSECCGLHIHVDKSALTPKQWGILLKFFTLNYNFFVSAGIFRPEKHFNDLSFLKNAIERYSEEELFNYFVNNVGHYSSISYSRSTGGKTIEFRCFDSTVKYDKFISNLKTIMMLLDNVDMFENVQGVQFNK